MSVTHNGPMPQTPRSWVKAGLPPGTYDALTDGLSGSRLWSLLLDVAEARAVRRVPAELMEQWDRDRFVQPGIADQRTIIDVDGHLLKAASAFESIELSPVAPLGACATMELLRAGVRLLPWPIYKRADLSILASAKAE